MSEFADLLPETFASLQVSRWGIGDISDCPWPAAAGFNRAASLLFAYDYGLEGYDEARYHELLHDKRHLAVEALDSLCEAFKRLGIRYLPVPGGQDQVSLEAAFSHKYAATRAGLGWIGRNSLLVTPEWGPRVFLHTVLFHADLQAADPINESRCGECRTCLDACPVSCIEGACWKTGTARDDMLDVFACNNYRLSRTLELGHKDECGFCLLACPIGRG